MKTIKGYHGEWNMGSPGGWDYQGTAQLLGKMAWDLILENIDVGVDLDFGHPQINAVPGFARMMLRAHRNRHGRNPVHAVLLAETETLDVVLENKNFVNYLNSMDGVKASLAGPGNLSLKNGKVCCEGEESTVIFMDFNMNTLIEIGQEEDIEPIKEAISQGILVNPRGMEPLGAKGLFEVITGKYKGLLSATTVEHTPWTRQFYPRSTTGSDGEIIEDLPGWVENHRKGLVLKPAHGYSGHGIFVGPKEKDFKKNIQIALDAGDYIVQEMVPLPVWSEHSAWALPEERSLYLKEWQTDFRCFITDEGLQGFLARFGGVPTNVGSGGGIQPLAILNSNMSQRVAVDKINQSLFKLGFEAFMQIQNEVKQKAIELGFTYLLGPIMVTLRPRLLTMEHMAELRDYAHNLWRDAVKLEKLWRAGQLDDVVQLGAEEKELAMIQPWRGSPALMVSDGLFSLGADLTEEEQCMPKLDPNWWKTLFDETYLITDARSIGDDNLTRREVDFIEEMLGLEKSWPILDLCGGQGRHSLELSRRGFQDVTVLDYSKALIDLGRERAQEERLNTLFLKEDARHTNLPSRRFRSIITMASSFGYFVDEDQNEEILREAFRLLMPKGSLLLDLPNRDHVLNHFAPQSWHEANEEIIVCRNKSLDEDIIYGREMVISKRKGLIRDVTYCTRLYSPEKITVMLKSTGFDAICIQKDFVSHEDKLDYGLMTNRTIVIAHKKQQAAFKRHVTLRYLLCWPGFRC